MRGRKSNVWLCVIIALFSVVLLALLAARDHYLLGSALILLRWGLVIAGLLLVVFAFLITTPLFVRVLLVAAIAGLFAETAWNNLQMHRLKEKSSLSTSVSIMTYNVFFRNVSTIMSIVKIMEADPDILLLQEVTPQWHRDLEERIGAQYPYREVFPHSGTYGIAVYSKYPIVHSSLLENDRNLPFAQVVKLNINHKEVQLINVHLSSPGVAVENPHNFIPLFRENYQQRKAQLDQINALTMAHAGEVDAQLLVGDLNTTRREPLYRDLLRYWVDLYDQKGKGYQYSFPNANHMMPVVTLDYILIRGNVRGRYARVIPGGSSDHLAVVGEIDL